MARSAWGKSEAVDTTTERMVMVAAAAAVGGGDTEMMAWIAAQLATVVDKAAVAWQIGAGRCC